MGTNNLSAVGNSPIPALGEHVDQYYTALNGVLLPRSAGVPTNQAGNIGSTTHRWGNAYVGNVDASGYSNINQVRCWLSAYSWAVSDGKISWGTGAGTRPYNPYNMWSVSDDTKIKFPYTGGYLIVCQLSFILEVSTVASTDYRIIFAGTDTEANRLASSIGIYTFDPSIAKYQVSYLGQFQANQEVEIIAGITSDGNTFQTYDAGHYPSWISVAKIW